MKKIILWIILGFFLGKSIAADNGNVTRNPFQADLATEALKPTQNGLINVDFTEVKVSEVLQLLANYAHKNIVIADSVNGMLSLHLQAVTWQQAVDTILVMQNLNLQQQGNILLIRSNAGNSNTNTTITTQSLLFKIRYANAADLAALLKSNGLLSANGVVSADVRTNSIWVQEQPQKLVQIRDFLQKIDVPVKQVMIKARIVNVDNSCLQELGIRFGTSPANNNVLTDGLNMDMPVSMNQNGRFNLAIATLGSNTLIDLELSALESEGHGKIISSPELMTADRTPAYIEAGEEVPYQEKTSSGATNVTFKKAVLSLKVVPQITSEKQIVLNLTVNQDKLSQLTVEGVPAIQTREIQTQVRVKNGQTIVLGGIYEQSDSESRERIPFLSALPVFGRLFHNKVIRSSQRELFIFVTPTVMDG